MIPVDLGPRTLRDLGHALIERVRAAEAADRAGRRELTPEGVERLAEIIAGGSRPSLGFVATGRQTASYSLANVGKSLLALDACAARASGRDVLGYPARPPIDILYVDLEMTEADLRERLTDMGYGPDDDLSHLHYYQLPPLPPLDGELGGQILTSIAIERGVDLVVIDTMARAVDGKENDADTLRAFYRFTGRILKAAGIALWRLDHQGKEEARGQRGSSSKDDDVDMVFRLTRLDSKTLKLTCTHKRVPWVPHEVTIVQHEEPVLRHVISADAVPAGTHGVIQALDELEDIALDGRRARAGVIDADAVPDDDEAEV